jgi:hypothetical protein
MFLRKKNCPSSLIFNHFHAEMEAVRSSENLLPTQKSTTLFLTPEYYKIYLQLYEELKTYNLSYIYTNVF